MLDQYGDIVPVLIEMPSSFDLALMSMHQIEEVLKARWYEDADGMLWVASEDIGNWLDACEFEVDEPMMYVDFPLRRFSEEDGFYHA